MGLTFARCDLAKLNTVTCNAQTAESDERAIVALMWDVHLNSDRSGGQKPLTPDLAAECFQDRFRT